MEDPRKNTNNHSSIEEDLPASFAICESRMNQIMLGRNDDNGADDDNEDEQKTLLQNLITNLRESEDDEFDLEDADHNYLSDEDEEEFPQMDFDVLQYASVRAQSLYNDDSDPYDDRNYWNTSRVTYDTDELLKNL